MTSSAHSCLHAPATQSPTTSPTTTTTTKRTSCVGYFAPQSEASASALHIMTSAQELQAQGAHKGEGREARRVDGAVAREVVHGAADGEDGRDVCDWGGEVQHEMPDMRAKQLVRVRTAIHENMRQEWLQPGEYQPKTLNTRMVSTFRTGSS
ncbi:hypothetical protein C8J57DRAFT_1587924 [Mycena rebaudengoi]|nr:hypothetical protein C8J57DRAFT_1587924 [Mycena rebaudengoi]